MELLMTLCRAILATNVEARKQSIGAHLSISIEFLDLFKQEKKRRRRKKFLKYNVVINVQCHTRISRWNLSRLVLRRYVSYIASKRLPIFVL